MSYTDILIKKEASFRNFGIFKHVHYLPFVNLCVSNIY